MRLALRNLASRPLRTALTLAGLSIPIVGMLGLLSLAEGIRALVGNTVSQVQGILVLRSNAPTDLFSELPAGLAESLRRVPGVRVVAAQVWKLAPTIDGRRGTHENGHGSPGPRRAASLARLLDLVQIEGQDLAEHARLRSEVYRSRMVAAARGGGRFLDVADEGRPIALLSSRLARQLAPPPGRPYRVGDRIAIGGQPFTIVGLYDTGSMLLDNTIIMGLESARRLLGLSDETVSCFHVEPEDPAAADVVAQAIERAVPGVDARTMAEFQTGADRLLGATNVLLLLMVGLALIVGSIGILNSMIMSTTERLGEFGILRTTGWSRGDLLGLVLAESVCMGLLAGLAGCCAGTLGAFAVNRLLGGDLRLVLTAGQYASVMAIAVALGALGGLAPAVLAARLAPMQVIRRGSL